ncbi:hypothetical protein BGZ76_005494 [Entomortierella beljakovae]|nr:hypothetical protein BGZ76_005494 [Entomortierella beljakovae]
MNTIPDKDSSVPIAATSTHIPQHAPPPRVTQPKLHLTSQNPVTNVTGSRGSYQQTPFSSNLPDNQESSENTANGSTLTWTQRLNYITKKRYVEPQGFIWDSLDSSMEDVQMVKQMRKNGPLRLVTNYRDKSYNPLRSTFRLHNAERRKNKIKNFVSLIRIALDYDVHKSRLMAVLNSKARIIIFTLLDAITAIPFLLSGAFMPYGQLLYVPYFLRSWSVISRLQRALSIGVDIGISDQPYDPVKAKLAVLVAYFIAIIYNGMAAFLYTETMFAPLEKPHTLGDAFYFILITASTVGYGDITPKSVEGKVVVMIFIIVALSVVPGLIAGTIETIKTSRSGGGSYFPSRGINGVAKRYLVMIGDFQNAKRVSDMLSGFLNKEFSDSDVRVVFLSRNKPSKDVKTLLDMHMHKNKTTILIGNGLDEIDLKRCQVRDASAVFVIPDWVTTDKESQDTMTTLLAWSLHIYAPDTRVFTFNLLPESESFQWSIIDQSMCIDDVKQLLLAYSCRHRGTSTLILNLLHPSEPLNSYNDGWTCQYGDGTGNEMYVGSVPEVFVGWTFAQASWFIFQEFQAVLIGVDIFLRHDKYSNLENLYKPMSYDLPKPSTSNPGSEPSDYCPEGRYHLTLNPGNSYRLGKFDQLIFIAQSPEDMDAIRNFTVDQYERLCAEGKSEINQADAEFAKAMEMYSSLRESRAKARADAKKRAEHRIKKHSKGSSRGVTKEQSGYSYDILSSPEEMTPMDEKSLTQQQPGSSRATMETRSRKVSHKNSRPAWNVALYDDEDDDDDDDDSAMNHSVQRTKSRVSERNSINYWQSRRSNPIDYDNTPVGALDREENGQNDSDFIPMSNRRLLPATRNSNQGVIPTVSTPLSNPEFYPSNFDRNAAAAAQEDKEDESPYHSNDKDKNDRLELLDEEKQDASSMKPIPIITKTSRGGGVGVGNGGNQQNIADPLRQYSNHSNHGSTYSSYQPLDETTYIGQSNITRSEDTMDLPMCHLLINPPATIKPLIRNDLSMQKDHIVVCANAGENLHRFLSTLRLAQIPGNDVKTIVVLTSNPHETVASDGGTISEMADDKKNGDTESDDTSQRAWSAILSFPRVFWVVGNCRKQRDLVRAGILGASNIVVMSHRPNGLDRDEFEDSTAIMAHHMISQTLQKRGLLGRQHIVVEICEKSNIRFLNLSVAPIRSDIRRRSMIKTKSSSNQDRMNPGGFWMTPIFASGQVLVSSLLDNVLYQAYSKAHVLDLVKLCCGIRFKQAIELDQILGIDCSNICLIEPPPLYVGKSFSAVFRFLSLGYGIVPLGIPT